MKILFTGGSSFTGFWFIRELAAAGHQITAVFRQPQSAYQDLRRQRVDLLAEICRPVFEVCFGDDRFLQLIKTGEWNLLAHHGAEVSNYRSPAFDIPAAIHSNAHRLPAVLDALEGVGCRKIIVTGSVFENDEGAGSENLRAFSPYGLSKAFTWQIFRYHAQVRGFDLAKFVIPNPFGPYEEPRFVQYLMRSWLERRPAVVNTPKYIRDNIHVSLLARHYVHRAESMPQGISRTNPAGYVESQGVFTERVARAMRPRLGVACDVELGVQTEFVEPYTRINTDRPTPAGDWNEEAAWDALAAYYQAKVTG